MSQAYSIEVGGRSAGIAIAERGGFVFFAAERAFSALEGRSFRHLRHAERAAERLLLSPADNRPWA
jgi:hypothetical protein